MLSAERLLLVQLEFLREHRQVAVAEAEYQSTVCADHKGCCPFCPVGCVGFPVIKRHNRDSDGLDSEYVTVDGYADAVQNCCGVQQAGVVSDGRSDQHDCGNYAAKHELSPEQPLAVDVTVEHLVEGQANGRQVTNSPSPGVDDLEEHVHAEHGTGNFTHQSFNFVFHQLLTGHLLDEGTNQNCENRTGTHSGENKEEEGPGPDEETFTEGVRTTEHNAVHTAQRTLVKGGQEGSDSCEQSHIHVQVMGKVVQERNLVQLLLLENQRNEFNDQNGAVAGNTEDNFCEHGVHVGVPVTEPCADGLPDIHGQNEHGSGVAQKSNYYCKVNNIFKLIDLENVLEKTGEECTGTKCDNCKVKSNPKAEPEVVVKAGYADAVIENLYSSVDAPEQDGSRKHHPEQELGQSAAFYAFGEEIAIHGKPPS